MRETPDFLAACRIDQLTVRAGDDLAVGAREASRRHKTEGGKAEPAKLLAGARVPPLHHPLGPCEKALAVSRELDREQRHAWAGEGGDFFAGQVEELRPD